MLASRQQTTVADENNRHVEQHGGKPIPPSKPAGTGKQQHNNNNISHNVAKAVQQQASNRRALGDIGNLVGAMPVRSNVSKESIQERYGAILVNSQNAAKQSSTMVEVKAEQPTVEVKVEVKTEDAVAAWGAKQKRTVISTKAHEIASSATEVSQQPPGAQAISGEAVRAALSAASNIKPGQAPVVGPARLKAHARLAAVKKEKEQTLTALLAARSEAACGRSDAETQEAAVSDIDQHDIGNQLAVVDYIEDIYTFYRKTEVQSCVPADYMDRQAEIKEKMRAILIDWLIEVHLKFKLMTETLYLTVNLIDRYLSVQSVSRKNLQLVGVTALLLAAKYEEIWAPEVNDFVHISDNAYTREQILHMEKTMLNTLQFNLTVPTPYVFVARCLKAAAADREEKAEVLQLEMLSWYLVELCLTEYSMVKFCPSQVAAAAVYMALNILVRETCCWGPALQLHSGYTESQLKECATMIEAFHSKAGTGSLTVVHKKYSNARFLSVAKLSPSGLSSPVSSLSS
ncbi:hypothetical protein CY35_04G058300 [Sphagnum magellanicum]|nr:hypothetical protein CY35_04G058300 [Sphagnum magellanicum]